MGLLGVVALFTSSVDGVAGLRKLLESAGFTVVSALIPDVREGRCDVDRLMHRHDPIVVLYDVGAPYEENWMLFQELRSTSMRNRRFVITSADAARAERLAARAERIFEIADQPSALDTVVHAVKEAARGRRFIPGAASSPPSNVTPITDRRFHSDRRQSSWTSNDIYRKLREKREEVESERRQFGRRASDRDHGPSSHAA